MIGQTLGHYDVLSRLGAGGMGEVFIARDLRLGREVALKVLPAAMAADPERRARFEREAKALAALRHPGIVTIFAIEEHDGVHFLTMELVDGSPLSERVPARGMDLDRLLAIAVPLTDAVGAAHAQGITHRDLKPANVMVDPAGRVKILDFGLATSSGPLEGRGESAGAGSRPDASNRGLEVTSAETAFAAGLTAEGRILGTVHYMSPEQAQGLTVDPRSDVFALGVLLYEMAAGERPFQGDSSIAILSSILKDRPAPLSERNRSLPGELERIVNRCLSKDPAGRYRDATALRDELEILRRSHLDGMGGPASSAIQSSGAAGGSGAFDSRTSSDSSDSHDPIVAPGSQSPSGSDLAPDPTGLRAPVSSGATLPAQGSSPSRGSLLRSRGFHLLLAVVLGGFVVGLVPILARKADDTAGPTAIGASGRPSVAVFQFRNHSGDEEIRWLASGVPSMLLTGLAQTPGLDVVSSARIEEILGRIGPERAEEIDQSILSEVARRSGAGAVVVGNIFKSGDTIRIDVQVEDVETGRLLFAREASGTDVFPIVDQLASAIRVGLEIDGEDVARPVAEVSSNSLAAYRAYEEGMKALNVHRLADANRFLREALALDPDFAMAHAKLAAVAGAQLDNEVVREHLQKAYELSGRLPDRDRSLVEARYLHVIERDRERAVRVLRELITRFPDEEEAYAILASPDLGGAEVEDALEVLRRGVEALPNSGLLRNQYAYSLLAAGRYARAIDQLKIYQSLEPEEPNPRDSLAEVYLIAGRPEEAAAEYREVQKLDPTFESAFRGRAIALSVLGRYSEALAEYDRSLGIIEAAGLAPHGLLGPKALLLQRIGRFREGLEWVASGGPGSDGSGDPAPGFTESVVRMAGSLRTRDYVGAIESSAAVMDQIPPEMPAVFQAAMRVQALLYRATAEARIGNLERARQALAELEALGTHPRVPWASHWAEGEIELAAGNIDAAEAAFLAGEPRFDAIFSNSQPGLMGTLLVNDPPSRDWRARILVARGDLEGAIAVYEGLNTPGPDQQFVAPYDPLHVLEIARLRDRQGDPAGAARECERFLEMWKDADPDRPEPREARQYLERAAG